MISSSQSREKKVHEEKISNKIACFYLKEYQIPDQPSFDRIFNIEFDQDSGRKPINIPQSVKLIYLNFLKDFFRILVKVKRKIHQISSNCWKF